MIRVSHRAGREDERFRSPLEQRETVKAWATRHGHEIAAWWDETDTVSGSTVRREGLQAAVDRAVSGRTDGIVVARLDRFARTLTEGLVAVGRLQEANRTFVAVNDGIEGEHTTIQGRQKQAVLFLLAEWQLDILRESSPPAHR